MIEELIDQEVAIYFCCENRETVRVLKAKVFATDENWVKARTQVRQGATIRFNKYYIPSTAIQFIETTRTETRRGGG